MTVGKQISMADEDSSPQENPTSGGVVLSNPEMPSLGFLFNYCIYDGVVNLKTLLESYRPEGMSNKDWQEEKMKMRCVLPTPRTGGGAFSQAVKTLQTKKQMRVLESPDKPLSTNKEGLRLRKGGQYGYRVQWSIIALSRNQEYALRRTKRGFLDSEPKEQVIEETLYRITLEMPAKRSARRWNREYLEHVYENGPMPEISVLRNAIKMTTMKAESVPENALFMNHAVRRLRNAFVEVSTSIDDDRMRKQVRELVVRERGILSSGSSGGSYFILDKKKEKLPFLKTIQRMVEVFAERSEEVSVPWAESNTPWWHTSELEESDDIEVPLATYTSFVSIMAYGSSEEHMKDIRNTFVNSLQKKQRLFYETLRKMVESDEMNLEELRKLRTEVIAELKGASSIVGKDYVEKAVEVYSDFGCSMADRLSSVLAPQEREQETAINEAMSLLSFDNWDDRI